jgi:hypothetical protein
MERQLKLTKKGVSEVVMTVVMIALSLAAIILVWSVVTVLIKGQMKSTEACFGNSEKIKLNGYYTCYVATTTSGPYALRFSIDIGNVDVEKIIVAIDSPELSQSYEIYNESSLVSGLTYYPASGPNVALPSKNGRKTYQTEAIFPSKISLIKIAPTISGTQCEVSDKIPQIENCDLISNFE